MIHEFKFNKMITVPSMFLVLDKFKIGILFDSILEINQISCSNN